MTHSTSSWSAPSIAAWLSMRCGAAADASGGVVMRAVAGAEPAAEIARAVADGDAAQVGADADLDQPFAGLVQGAVLVGGGFGPAQIGVLRDGVDQFAQIDRAARLDLLRGAAANEHGLAQPFDSQLGAFRDPADIDLDRGESLDVGRGVHLVHKRPGGGTGGHRACARRGIIEEIPPGAYVVICVGHGSFSNSGRRTGRYDNPGRVSSQPSRGGSSLQLSVSPAGKPA